MSTRPEARPAISLESQATESEEEEDYGPGWLRSNPVRAAALAIGALSLLIHWAVLREGYFLTDDFMLSTRAAESELSLTYLFRVHTGHLEPIGFGYMWLLTMAAPLNWPVAVLSIVVGQAILLVLVWRLLVELFESRPLVLVPFTLFAMSPLTLTAFSWLSAAIIWLPLMISTAGLLRAHIRYVRSPSMKGAVVALAWLILGMLSFEKILVVLPYLVAITVVARPEIRLRVRELTRLVRRTALVWVLYAVATGTYLAYYLWAAARADAGSRLQPPEPGVLFDFMFLTVMKSFVPGAVGGPWDWFSANAGGALQSSPESFIWMTWIVAFAVVATSLWLRRLAARAWFALAVYVAASAGVLALSRVPIIGAIAGLETRYLADATIPLVVTLGICLMPLRGEKRPWYPAFKTIPQLRSALRVGVSVILVLFVALSLRATGSYAPYVAANPHRPFVETVRSELKKLPPKAEIYDDWIPVDVIGPLFLEYNYVSRFLAPFIDDEWRSQLYGATEYRDPYVLTKEGKFVRMDVAGVTNPEKPEGSCPWVNDGGTIRVPLYASAFDWSWAVRISYLADRDAEGTVRLGKAAVPITIHEGLNRAFVHLVGGGPEVMITGLSPDANVCVGDVAVGTPVPSTS